MYPFHGIEVRQIKAKYHSLSVMNVATGINVFVFHGYTIPVWFAQLVFKVLSQGFRFLRVNVPWL